MVYELWESTGGNMIAGFPSKKKALEAVRMELLSGSESEIGTWMLLHENEKGETEPIASGQALLDLAQEAYA